MNAGTNSNARPRVAARAHLFEAGEIVIEMFDHVEAGYQIERVIFVGKLFSRTLFDLIETALSTKTERLGRDVNTLGHAKLRKHFQIRARAATDVKNFQVGLLQPRGDRGDKAAKNFPAADKPPVALLDLDT